MNIKYTLTNFQLVLCLAKLASCLGIIPWHNYKKRITCVNLFKCFSITSVAFTTAMLAYFIFFRLQLFLTHMVITTIQFLQGIGGLALFTVMSLGSAFWNRTRWEEFFNLIYRIESMFNVYNIQKKRNMVSIYALILTTISAVIPLYLVATDFVISGFPPLFLAFDIFNYTYILIAIIINYTVVYIKTKLEDINDFLSRLKYLNYNSSETIENIRALYIALFQFFEICNDLFGWPLLFLHFYFFILLENFLLYFSRTIILKQEAHAMALITIFIIIVTAAVSIL